MRCEPIKTWRKDGFTLRLWTTGGYNLAYEFKDGRQVIFSGSDFRPSHMHAIDSLETVYGLLGFLALDKGDTDWEYFDKYTTEQHEWRESQRRQDLDNLVTYFEIRRENRRGN